MRTIFRLCLAAAVTAAIGLVAVPVASANTGPTGHASITNFEKKQNKKIRKAKNKANKAHERIENLKAWNFDLDAHNRRQDTDLQKVEGTVNTILAGVPDIIGGLTALQEGLVAIQGALEDPVTGLLGLNLARPQFGVLAADATFLGGTGAAGGQGPVDDSDTFVGGSAVVDVDGSYVVDFNNDVSQRMYSVNVFPLGATGAGGGGAIQTASAINCDTPGIDAICGIVQGGPAAAADPDPNKVLVQYGNGSAGGPPNGFSVTALSG